MMPNMKIVMDLVFTKMNIISHNIMLRVVQYPIHAASTVSIIIRHISSLQLQNNNNNNNNNKIRDNHKLQQIHKFLQIYANTLQPHNKKTKTH
jgi:hypothetical protein